MGRTHVSNSRRPLGITSSDVSSSQAGMLEVQAVSLRSNISTFRERHPRRTLSLKYPAFGGIVRYSVCFKD